MGKYAHIDGFHYTTDFPKWQSLLLNRLKIFIRNLDNWHKVNPLPAPAKQPMPNRCDPPAQFARKTVISGCFFAGNLL